MSREIMITTLGRDDADGYWIDIEVENQLYDTIGPFDTAAERQRANQDLLEMMRQSGAKTAGRA